MTSCLLILNWNDLVTSLAQSGIRPNPILIGRALLKQVSLRARLEQAHAVGDWSTPEGAAAGAMLQRLGYITHAVGGGASPLVLDQMVSAILRQAPPADEILLVSHPLSGRAVIDALRDTERRVSIWHPHTPVEALASLPPHIGTQDLVKVLHLDTANTTGIFVDWTHVEAGLKELNVCVEPEALADGLLRCASLLGEVTIARAYGPFNDGFANTNGNGRGGGRV